MSGLSWLIYLIGFVVSLNVLLSWAIAVSIVAAVISTIVIIARGINLTDSRRNADNKALTDLLATDPWLIQFRTYRNITVVVLVIVSIVAVVIPSQRTMTMIAAAEVTLHVINNPKVVELTDKAASAVGGLTGEAVDLLHTWMDKSIKDLKTQMDTPATAPATVAPANPTVGNQSQAQPQASEDPVYDAMQGAVKGAVRGAIQSLDKPQTPASN